MYQSDVQRFERSKNTDLFVTFFPLVLAFGLRGFLLKTGLPEAALFAAQALLAVFLDDGVRYLAFGEAIGPYCLF